MNAYNIDDIIYATTCKERQGFCNITYCDGSTDIISATIGGLYEVLSTISKRGGYFMIGRSSLICANNIVRISPMSNTLVMAFDVLNKKHQILGFSDNLLRELRKDISTYHDIIQMP